MGTPEAMLSNAGSVTFERHFRGSVFSSGLTANLHVLPNDNFTMSPVAEHLTEAAETVTAQSGPLGLVSLLGKYNNDPSWEAFPDFLQRYRAEIYRMNE